MEDKFQVNNPYMANKAVSRCTEHFPVTAYHVLKLKIQEPYLPAHRHTFEHLL
jgi:hypothetical protein